MSFNEQFKQLRLANHVGVNQLALRAGINASTISKLEHGQRTPKPATLKKLAHGLRVPTNKIFRMAGLELKLPSSAIMPKGYINIPVLGSIPCGDPNSAIKNTDEFKPVPNDDPHIKNCFFLRANGHSMEPRIKNGALVKIEMDATVGNKDIVAVSVNEEDATLKQVIMNENKIIMLHPLNPAFKDIFPSSDNDCCIIGKAIEETSSL